MMNRFGLDRFKKATSAEPFSVTQKVITTQQQHPQPLELQVPTLLTNARVSDTPALALAVSTSTAPVSTTSFGAGGSTWKPPDWAVDPKPNAYWLDVMKDGDVVDKITLFRRRLIFGRQHALCDLVLDHPSVSRQHAAIVQHKNGGIYVFDLGSVHGTFVANERLMKDIPVELEVGQSLRFAASTRIYVLRKNVHPAVVPVPPPTDVVLPPPPDPSDEEAVLAYNTSLNKLGVTSPSTLLSNPSSAARRPGTGMLAVEGKEQLEERPSKKARKSRVSFRDDYGGILAEVVGVSDGADVSTEPGPVGVREGSLVGKYESLVQVTVIPKGQDDGTRKLESGTSQGVTQRLQQYLDKVKSPGKGASLYGDIYGESIPGIAGGSWATVQTSAADNSPPQEGCMAANTEVSKEKLTNGVANAEMPTEDLRQDGAKSKLDANFIDDDLFGDDDEA